VTHPDLELGDSFDAVLADNRRLGKLQARMVLFACRRRLDLADAEDIVADTLEKLLRAQRDPATAWKPSEKPMWRYITGALMNEHRTWSRRRDNRAKEALGSEHEKFMPQRPLAEQIEMEDHAGRVKQASADETEEGIGWPSVLARCEGADTYEEIAIACKCTVQQVRAARERLLDRMDDLAGVPRRSGRPKKKSRKA
jgi:DNA-directed RNA polymerase specialized sigma24 family protein